MKGINIADMSFSSDINERISQPELQCPNCAAAELAGALRVAGRISADKIKFTTENKSVADRIGQDLSEGFGLDCHVRRRDGSRAYQFLTDDIYEAENIIGRIMSDDILPFACCRASYVRGAFLGGGSVSNPQKSYHLEFDTKSKEEAEFLGAILSREGFPSKITYRKGYYIVYVKECEAIADILGYIGAGNSALEMFTIQIEKEMRNEVNRRVNCENANADKAARASGRHLVAIRKITDAKKFDKMPEVLQEIARLRMEFPEDSLKELGEKTDPPIGKSGVNHRLNRIMEFAENI
ncbi:MAG: DNA-binding protein WhiA [Oscillospiraceae bacterium]|nr:DNA-binding protein WhiA [Oscillospiraceae bacterium]